MRVRIASRLASLLILCIVLHAVLGDSIEDSIYSLGSQGATILNLILLKPFCEHLQPTDINHSLRSVVYDDNF